MACVSYNGLTASGLAGVAATISSQSASRITSYEISDEINRFHIQHLERKYGGRLRAHSAATKIQRAFRRHRLEQQWQTLKVSGPSGSARNQGLSTPRGLTDVERQMHLRKLALSQPSLKYQPVTSLRTQLRMERDFTGPAQHARSPRAADPHSAVSITSPPPAARSVERSNGMRPYVELMSPRLSQRRATNASGFQHSPQYAQLVDGMHASPRSSFTIHRTERSPASDLYHVVSVSSEQTLEVGPPVIVAGGTSPSVWVPRHDAIHGQHSADGGRVQHPSPTAPQFKVSSTASPNQLSFIHQSSPHRELAGYNTNSLPRMGRRHEVQPTHQMVPRQENRSSSMVQHAVRDWPDQHRRRLYRIALNFFNKKPDRGVQLLIHWGFVEDNPQAIAKLFLGRRGLSKQMIGEFLGTLHSPFHAAVLERFVNEIPMFDMEIDVALRQLLTHFRLPGEAQKIDHIMQVFSKRYRSCNPGRLAPHISPDTIYVLAFAIIMLNTDLHTPSLKDSKRMKLDEFVKNVCGIEDGSLLDRNMLAGIYERIKEREFRPGSDHVTQVMKVDQSIVGKDKPKLVEPHRRLICYCRLHQVLDPHKKQPATAHQREIFLFNDLMIIAKVVTRKKSVGQYTLRSWTPLIGLRITEFQNAFYAHGLIISCADGQEFFFNAKNNDDRFRFAADVKESVAESTEMEQIRIDMELDKQLCASGLGLGAINGRFVRADSQRDSGLPEMDHPSPGLPSVVGELGHPVPSGSVSTTYAHGGVANGSLNCSGSTGPPSANGTPAAAVRRLSYNSLDSGVVEETADLSV